MDIKTSDFIFKHLVEKHGIKHAFMVTGGGAMHLNDSVGHTKGLSYICTHHEQSAAIAAEGYYRACGELCVVNVTTGPGGTNAITGVLGQWLDSIPALYISGQVKQSTSMHTYPGLRQLGDQEADIVSIVKPITKYAVRVTNAADIQYELDKAIHIALSGRPGPVWLDIPLDVQAENINSETLKKFETEKTEQNENVKLQQQIEVIFEKIKKAKSPVIYVGGGVRLCGKTDNFIKIAERLNIPVVTSISGSDILAGDNPLYFGRPGICGDRIGNIMVQNSDLLIILGTRLGIRQTGYAYDLFAPKAYKIMVDTDNAELNKPTLSIDLKINADLRDFFHITENNINKHIFPSFSKWMEWGRQLEKKIPTIFDDNPSTEGYVNSYVFAYELFKQLKDGDIAVTANGTAYTSTFQAMYINKGVRVFANQGCASMGYDLPAVIGAAVTNNKGKTIVVSGDGSIQMNLQELQTIVHYKLPVKIFVLENKGYLAIKTTQNSFFGGHFTGSDPSSGVSCPDLEKIAYAYNIPFQRVNQEGEALRTAIEKTLNTKGAAICELTMHPLQSLYPKSASSMDENGKMTSAPLEKMAPFMPDELQKECIYKAE